jgi:hypothetical protein
MKKMMKFMLTALIAAFLFTTVSFAQTSTTEITITVNKKSEKLFTRTVSGQKSFDFFISGLTTQQEIDAFVLKFKALKGVVDMTVSSQMTDNKWSANAIFIEGAKKILLANTLTAAGVSKVVINGVTIPAAELAAYKFKATDK